MARLKLFDFGKRRPPFPEALANRALGATLKALKPASKVVVVEQGVNSYCTIERGTQFCRVHVFHYLPTVRREPVEYSLSFYANLETSEEPCAMGRVSSEASALEAIQTWLGGGTVKDLYARYEFVDQSLRALWKWEKSLFLEAPELEKHCTSHLKQPYKNADSYALWLNGEGRSCKIFTYGNEVATRFELFWDKALLAGQSCTEPAVGAALVEHWFVKRTLPSALPTVFPEIALSRLVPYYEDGRGLEGEFIESWVQTEHFFADWAARRPSPVLDTLRLLQALKASGYDTRLRAGQSMSTFIVSRSRYHGLRTQQSSLSFETWGGKLRVSGQLGEEKIALEYERLTLNEEIEQLVARLAELPIDSEEE